MQKRQVCGGKFLGRFGRKMPMGRQKTNFVFPFACLQRNGDRSAVRPINGQKGKNVGDDADQRIPTKRQIQSLRRGKPHGRKAFCAKGKNLTCITDPQGLLTLHASTLRAGQKSTGTNQALAGRGENSSEFRIHGTERFAVQKSKKFQYGFRHLFADHPQQRLVRGVNRILRNQRSTVNETENVFHVSRTIPNRLKDQFVLQIAFHRENHGMAHRNPFPCGEQRWLGAKQAQPHGGEPGMHPTGYGIGVKKIQIPRKQKNGRQNPIKIGKICPGQLFHLRFVCRFILL